MEIKIMGHRKAAVFLAENPKEWDVIMISNPNHFFAIEGSTEIPALAKSICKLAFNDLTHCGEQVTNAFPGCILAKEDHVKEALEFAKDKKKILVCCQMGISRSSAMAYLIKASQSNMFEALEVLDPRVHEPNQLVIQLGSKVLKNPDISDLILTWKNKASELQILDTWEL